MTKPTLTIELVTSLLRYDPSNGHFYWIANRKGRMGKPGRIAGSKNGRLGYVVICVAAHHVYAHRLAWFVTHGNWPSGNIDHINGDPKDNRIANLRICNQSQNNANAKPNRRNTSGYRGVCFDKSRNKYVCRVGKKHVGRFDTPTEAASAYQREARLAYGDFVRSK
jgi:hypothetical protein